MRLVVDHESVEAAHELVVVREYGVNLSVHVLAVLAADEQLALEVLELILEVLQTAADQPQLLTAVLPSSAVLVQLAVVVGVLVGIVRVVRGKLLRPLS